MMRGILFLCLSFLGLDVAYGANAQLQCGAGLHSGGAVPGHAGTAKEFVGNYSSEPATHYIPVVAGENIETIDTKQTCPYGKCSCGIMKVKTEKKTYDINWVPLQDFDGDTSKIFDKTLFADRSYSSTQQLSNLKHILGSDRSSSRMAAIELYEDLSASLGEAMEFQIRALISTSIGAIVNQKMDRVITHYNDLVNQLNPQILETPPAALTAYRQFLKGESS